MNEISPIIKRIQIANIIAETPDAKTFVLNFPYDWEPVYKPGQFITLVFFTKHGEKRRSYSISSATASNEPFAFTVKKVENGEFSRLLLSQAKVGDILFTSGISGFFVLPEKQDTAEMYFFLAAGSGITPCFSLIKTTLATRKARVVLIYSNRNRQDCIFLKQLESLERDFAGRFTVNFLFSDIPDVYRSRLSKWLLQQLLDKYLDVPEKSALFYICGPFEYMRMIGITLLERVPANNIIKESFVTLPRLVIPRPPDTEPHKVTITINKKQFHLEVQYPVSILATAKAHQITLPYSCEAGRCGSCAATCTSGKVWMAYNEVLTDEEIGKGRVLVCQGFPIEADAAVTFD